MDTLERISLPEYGLAEYRPGGTFFCVSYLVFDTGCAIIGLYVMSAYI